MLSHETLMPTAITGQQPSLLSRIFGALEAPVDEDDPLFSGNRERAKGSANEILFGLLRECPARLQLSIF